MLRLAVFAAHPLDLLPTMLAAHRDVLEDNCRKQVLETQQRPLSIMSRGLAEGTPAKQTFAAFFGRAWTDLSLDMSLALDRSAQFV
ncbi:MAG: hypothetical protein MRY77_03380 [Rhodobacteraceae bacterium]|nr:hypothetical protein [Paracoccaceae bacterium]